MIIQSACILQGAMKRHLNIIDSRAKDVAFIMAASHLQKLQKTTTSHKYFGCHCSPILPCLNNIVFYPFDLHNVYFNIFHALSKPQFLGGFLHDIHVPHHNWLWRLHTKLLHRPSSLLLVLVCLLNSIFYFCCTSGRN